MWQIDAQNLIWKVFSNYLIPVVFKLVLHGATEILLESKELHFNCFK